MTQNESTHGKAFPAGYAAPRMSARGLPPINCYTDPWNDLTPAERKQTYKIAQIGADGIGPEVINAGVKLLHAAAEKLGKFNIDFTELDWSSDRYKKTGSYLPEDYLDVLRAHDAIL